MYYESTYPAMYFPLRRGLGAAAPLSTEIESAAAGALFKLAPMTGPAAPFVAAAGAIAALLATFGVGSGCGQTCVLSSQYANQANAALEENIEAYFAIPTPRNVAYQQEALANYESVWQDLVQQCSNPSLSTAGQKCISDRQAGACTWTQPASSVPPWGTPAAGECWNWDNGYRAPIADDTNVTDSPLSTLTAAASSVSSDLGAYALPAAILGGILLLSLVL